MRLAHFLLQVPFLLFATSSQLLGDEDVGKVVYKKVLDSTVYVISSAGTGSGWVYDKDKKLVVTNYHVVAKQETSRTPNDPEKHYLRIVADPVVYVMFPMTVGGEPVRERSFYSENRSRFAIKARVVHAEPKSDIAFLALESIPENATALQTASARPEPGERVHTVGNPGASGALWVYTSGTVRSVYHKKFRTSIGDHECDVIETSAPLNPGDSGGPVVNDEGKVVGLVQSGNLKAQLVSICVAVSEVAVLSRFATEAPESSADIVEAARTLFRTGQYREAIAQLDTAIEKAPDNADAWQLRGSSYGNLFEWASAIRDMNKAIELRPYEYAMYFDRGLCHYHVKDYNKAIDDFNSAISNGVETADAYFHRGLAYDFSSEKQWAINDYSKALEVDPQHLRAIYNRAVAYQNLANSPFDPNVQRAIDDYRRYLQAAPAGHYNIENAENSIQELFRRRNRQ